MEDEDEMLVASGRKDEKWVVGDRRQGKNYSGRWKTAHEMKWEVGCCSPVSFPSS